MSNRWRSKRTLSYSGKRYLWIVYSWERIYAQPLKTTDICTHIKSLESTKSSKKKRIYAYLFQNTDICTFFGCLADVRISVLDCIAMFIDQDVPTRWESKYDMCKRLTLNQRAIERYAYEAARSRPIVKFNSLNQAQWELLEQLRNLLKPLKQASKFVSQLMHLLRKCACCKKILILGLQRWIIAIGAYSDGIRAAVCAGKYGKLVYFGCKDTRRYCRHFAR